MFIFSFFFYFSFIVPLLAKQNPFYSKTIPKKKKEDFIYRNDFDPFFPSRHSFSDEKQRKKPIFLLSKDFDMTKVFPMEEINQKYQELSIKKEELEKEYRKVFEDNQNLSIQLEKNKIYIQILKSVVCFLFIIIAIIILFKICSLCSKKNTNSQYNKIISLQNMSSNENKCNNFLLLKKSQKSKCCKNSNKRKNTKSALLINEINCAAPEGVANSKKEEKKIKEIKEKKEKQNILNSLEEEKIIEEIMEKKEKQEKKDDLIIDENDYEGKTLTNDPNIYVESKTDKQLYKPYPIDEIK